MLTYKCSTCRGKSEQPCSCGNDPHEEVLLWLDRWESPEEREYRYSFANSGKVRH